MIERTIASCRVERQAETCVRSAQQLRRLAAARTSLMATDCCASTRSCTTPSVRMSSPVACRSLTSMLPSVSREASVAVQEGRGDEPSLLRPNSSTLWQHRAQDGPPWSARVIPLSHALSLAPPQPSALASVHWHGAHSDARCGVSSPEDSLVSVGVHSAEQSLLPTTPPMAEYGVFPRPHKVAHPLL